ncbi:MAG TPA: ABC transporter substrate binding protein [Thauera sp.]|jgi:putative ABC transport system substrate-binding protein|nr:ABC transporter substrate binding protein [Thauera sp.]HRA80989.1 ABC transporter substrate binding protein [Thauera sp.]
MHRALGRLLRLLLFAGLLTISALSAAAPRVLVLTPAFDGVHAEILDALRAALPDSPTGLEVETLPATAENLPRALAASIVVTLGSEAAALVSSLPAATPVLHIMLPAAALGGLSMDHRRAMAIVLDQPASRLVALLRLALPAERKVALISGPGSQLAVDELQRTATEAGLRVARTHVASNRELFAALERVLAEPAVLIASPDSTVFNRHTVQNILLTTFRRHSPVMGFSAAYVQAGAMLGLYSTPRQIGEDGADAVLELLAGKPQAAIRSPNRFEVGVNRNVARALSFELPSAETLTRDLRREEGDEP